MNKLKRPVGSKKAQMLDDQKRDEKKRKKAQKKEDRNLVETLVNATSRAQGGSTDDAMAAVLEQMKKQNQTEEMKVYLAFCTPDQKEEYMNALHEKKMAQFRKELEQEPPA